MPRAPRLPLCAIALLIGYCALFGPALATDGRAVSPELFGRPSPGMEGHGAEAQWRDAAAEAQHRRLFFDPAARDIGEAGVSCDHRVARRPELSAGVGAVAVIIDDASGRVLTRLWLAPPLMLDDAEVEREARRLTAARPGQRFAMRRFAWCR